MASADAQGTRSHFFAGFETFERRTLMAIVPVGAPGVLLGTGVTAVESASATPDDVDQFRYASVLSGAGGAGGSTTVNVVPVTGLDSSNPGTPLAVSTTGAVSNTDVASNAAADRVVLVYQVTTTTTTPPPNGGPGPGTTVIDANIFAAVYANGVIVGQPSLVNTTVAGQQTDCRVAMDGRGNFVVVWQSTTNNAGVVGRRFNADGTPRGQEFTIAESGVEPDISATAGGEFAVTYSVVNGDDDDIGTYLERFSAGGGGGTPIRFSDDTFSQPAVGLANSGRGVLAYVTGTGTGRRVVAQRFGLDGNPTGGTFAASSANNLPSLSPQVGTDLAGGFAIGFAFSSAGTAAFDSIGFRLFTSTGVARAPDTVISGVRFTNDARFGLAYRLPGTVHIAYVADPVDDGDPATPLGETQGLMQTYVDDTATGDATEVPVPAGGLLIDTSADLDGSRILVRQTGTQLFVTIDGVETGYLRSTFTSLYVRGGVGPDLVRFNENVTVPSIIYTRAGSDTIFAGNGNDVIDGGDGNQLGRFRESTLGNAIQARDGDDFVYGGSGPDTLFGGGGVDRILGGPGKNLIYGEDGNDALLGGSRNDFMMGGTGNDSMTGGGGGDQMDGGTGNDSIDGEDGVDRIFGNNGNDLLIGGTDNDSLSGGRGNDTLFGNFGRDTLLGGANADILRGGGLTERDNFFNVRPTREQVDVYFYDESDTVSGFSFRVLVI